METGLFEIEAEHVREYRKIADYFRVLVTLFTPCSARRRT
jgi:hypothetical protein